MQIKTKIELGGYMYINSRQNRFQINNCYKRLGYYIFIRGLIH